MSFNVDLDGLARNETLGQTERVTEMGRRSSLRAKSYGRKAAGTGWRTQRGGKREKNQAKASFGIVPTYESSIMLNRAQYIKNLRQSREKEANKGKAHVKTFESPTSIRMKNTFLFQNNNPSFDNYAEEMRKRKKNLLGSPQKKKDDNEQLGEQVESSIIINKKNPSARDGHIAVLHQGMMLIFGGDRHHMPFNDLFMLDLNDFLFS